MSVLKIQISENQHDQRLDNFLIRELKGVPKSRIYRAIRKGEVRVNGKRKPAEYRLAAGDEVRIPPIRQAERSDPPKINEKYQTLLSKSIILDHQLFILINKPDGLAVHGGSGVSLGIIEGLRQLYPKADLELVHRLDKDTSGCLLIAKKRSFLRYIQEKLREKDINKRYLLLVHGIVDFDEKRVEAPLQKFTLISGERMVTVNKEGKPAVTLFKTLRRGQKTTLLEAQPITGRTHQIRVHAKYIGYPIVGDSKYGDQKQDTSLFSDQFKKRLYLHAASLSFKLEEGELISVCALNNFFGIEL